MRTSALVIAAAAALALASSASAEWKQLNGQPAPPVEAKEWINVKGDAPSLDSLRGKVFLLEFFATW